MSVIVFGSINMDLVVQASRVPLAGETITGEAFFEVPGGKGANQAVAAALLGVRTTMVGRVGNDEFGVRLLQGLRLYGIDTEGVSIDPEITSGLALIIVDYSGQNRIIVVPGANGRVGEKELDALDYALEGVSVMLLQLETPMDVVTRAARIAASKGIKIVLDPAPVPAFDLPPELYRLASIITPNETEAALLVGFPLENEKAIEDAGRMLLQRGAGTVIIKLGSRGIYWTNGETAEFRSTFQVKPVDTVAAGDAFNGALAVALDEGKSFSEAVDWGLAAGALAVTKSGAQSSLPDRAALLTILTHGTRNI